MKTNIIYPKTITDIGSSSPGTFFDEQNIASVLAGDSFGSMAAWGNAVEPAAVIRKNNDTTPTTGSVLTAINSRFSSLTISPDETMDYSVNVWNQSDGNDSIGLDFGSSTTINALRVIYSLGAAGLSTQLRPCGGNFTIYKSDNNSTWTLIQTEAVSKSLSRGEHIFVFSSPQTARYFKINAGYVVADLSGNSLSDGDCRNGVPFEISINRIYGIDTSRAASIKFTIDLGKPYKASRFFLESFFGRNLDRSNVSIRSSADDITYSSNLASFGGSWTSLASAPENGEPHYSPKDRAIYVLGNTINTIHKYDILANQWTTTSTGLAAISGSPTFRSAFDAEANTIYSYGNGKQFYFYNITFGIGGQLPDAPYALGSYTGMTCGSGKVWATQTTSYISGNQGNETYNSLLYLILQYDIYLQVWEEIPVVPCSPLTEWPAGPTQPLYIKDESIASGSYGLYFYGIGPTYPCLYYVRPYNYIGLYGNFFAYTGFGSIGGGFTFATFNSIKFPAISAASPSQRYSMAYDPDKKRIYTLGSTTTGGRKRYFDMFYDVNRQNLYAYPGASVTSYGGDTYQFGGTTGTTYMAYAPEVRKLYRLGSADGAENSTTFMSYDVDQFNQIKATLSDGDRYIKVENTSSYSWPFIVRHMQVIADTTDIKFQKDAADVFGIDTDLVIGSAGSATSFDIYNPSGSTMTSGTAYIEPDGTEGSRYSQIALTSSGTWVAHCDYNDLTNFQCTASNSNYNTVRCSRACTSGTGNFGYTRSVVSVPDVASSGTQTLYTRSYVPSTANESDRLARVIVELT